MFFLLPLVLAILAGAIRSRQLSALLLWELRAVFLLPLALFTALLPFWLATYWPDLLWTESRQLLMILQLASRGLYLAFVLVNLVLTARRTSWTSIKRHARIIYLHVRQRFQTSPHRIPADHTRFRHPSRNLSPLRLLGLVLAVPGLIGQMLVLWSNQGYWPLSVRYLDFVKDPLLVEGIKNGALRMARLIDGQTRWAFLGRTIPLPALWERSTMPVAFISPTDLILALALFLILFSLFPARRQS